MTNKGLRITEEDVLTAFAKPPEVIRPWLVLPLAYLDNESYYWHSMGRSTDARAAEVALFHAVEHDQTEVVVVTYAETASNDIDDFIAAIAPKAFVTWMDGCPIIAAGSEEELAAIKAWCEVNVTW